jgi:hypothetical protein
MSRQRHPQDRHSRRRTQWPKLSAAGLVLALILILTVALAGGSPACAQASNAITLSSQVTTPQGTPAVNAAVRICLITAFGSPCSISGVTLYSDANLTHPITDPQATDQFGNYSFFTTAGAYIIQITPSGVRGPTYTYYVIGGGSGSGTVTGTGTPGNIPIWLTSTSQGNSPLSVIAGSVASSDPFTAPSITATTAASAFGAGSTVNSSIICTAANGACPAGTGTVTSVSVVTANGVSGTVSNPTTTPAITLTLGVVPLSAGSTVGGILPCLQNGTDCPAGGSGAFLLAPTGSQTVIQPSGTTSMFTETATGDSSPTLIAPSLNCYGQGYDLGNNGTSAQGWSNCDLFSSHLVDAARGINQAFPFVMSHNGQGDTAAFYSYLTAFGGNVATSDEAVTADVMHSNQIGYAKGTASNGFSGSGHVYLPDMSSGYTIISGFDIIPSTGNLGTITINFAPGAGIPTAQVVDALIATVGPANSFTITNIIPITIAAIDAPQTFVSGVGFTPVSVTAGQVVGLYMPVGVGPAHDSIAQYALLGPPSLGTATYNTSGIAGAGGLSISTTMDAPSTGSTTLSTTGLTCNGYCTALAGFSWADGGIMLDTSKGGDTATIVTEGSTMNSLYYTLGSGTVPVSTAWGNIIVSQCTNNGNGQWQNYTSTTCNVTLGTSPASPGNFVVSGADVCLSGPFQEESAVTAVGVPSGGVQSVTFNTRYAWDNGNSALMMQGGACGQAFIATGTVSSWPVAYAVVGATSSTQVFFSNCRIGNCNGTGGTGNILAIATSIDYNPFGNSLVRSSNIVTAANINGGSFDPFPVGSTITISGATPSDFDGTFTVLTNTYDNNNPRITWAQTGSDESASTAFIVSLPPTGITFYPDAFITGTAGSGGSTVTLGTNTVPFTTSDTLIGAPTSQYSQSGYNLYIGQTTASTGSNASQGFAVDDEGPSPLTHDYVAQNFSLPANAGAIDMFYISGVWPSIFDMGYRPSNNGCILCVGGSEPISPNPKAYTIFSDNNNGGAGGTFAGTFGYNPNTGQFSFASSTGTPTLLIEGSPACTVGNALCNSLTPSFTSVTINGGANTVYVCSGGSFAGLLATSSAACTGGTGTATSLHID